MRKVVFICLLLLGLNGVLIQTVTTDNVILKNGIRIFILLVMMFFMLVKKRPIMVVPFVLLIISVISMILGHNSDQLSFIFVFIFIQSLFMIKTQKVEKYIMLSSLISLSLVFVFLGLGITHNRVIELRNRMTFGTNGVPFFFNLVYGAFAMLMIYTLKYMQRYKVIIALFSIGITTYLYVLTNARGGYLSFIGFLFLIFIVRITKRSFFFKRIVSLLPVFFLASAFLMASVGDNLTANVLLSNRPMLLHNFFNHITINNVLASTSVKSFDATQIVDNSYIHLLAGGGVFIAFAVIYLYRKAVMNLYRHEKYIEIAFVISTSFYFYTESILVRLENMFIIYFWYLMIKYSLTNVKEEVTETPTDELNTPNVKKKRRFKRYRIVW